MDASTNAAIAAGISKPPPAPGSEFRKDTIQSGPEPGFEHDESADLKKLPHVDGVDEFGGHRKVDPAEIALVRKLDRYMLVRLCLLLLRLRSRSPRDPTVSLLRINEMLLCLLNLLLLLLKECMETALLL